MKEINYKLEKYLYLSSGKGPAECEWVVMKLLNVISSYCDSVGLSHTITHTSDGYHKGAYKSVQLLVSGKELDDRLSQWIGTIQWIGKSIYRPHHKRTNWYVRIDLLDIEDEIHIDEKDLEYKAYRASGPGGQHRNKVESAIKAVHRPTGIETISSDSRSQHQNKVMAKERLLAKIKILKQSQKIELANTKNQMNNQLVRGNSVKTFKGEKFKEI